MEVSLVAEVVVRERQIDQSRQILWHLQQQEASQVVVGERERGNLQNS